MQDVVELERDGKGVTLEETLGKLCVPDQFVGVHRVVGITATALHVQVRGERGAPGSRDTDHATIGELPGVEVIIGLQLAARTGIVQRTVEFNL